MAQANIGSRRACEDYIRQGRVRVNGKVIELGAKADPAVDTVTVDGERLQVQDQPKVYIALNKPVNVLSSRNAQKGDPRRTVFDLVPKNDEHLFLIGRLDAESQGLVILTNDGELTNRLTHPRYQHTKTYKVTVYGLPTAAVIEQWERGIYLPEDGLTAPCSVRVTRSGGGLATLQIIMTEGKKRQIRRVATQLGHPVRHLTRTHIGQFALGDLKSGDWRELTPADVRALRSPDPTLRRAPPRKQRRK